MLRPHDREDAELDEVRLAAQRVEDALIFFGGEAVLGDDFGRDRIGHAAPLSGGYEPGLVATGGCGELHR